MNEFDVRCDIYGVLYRVEIGQYLQRRFMQRVQVLYTNALIEWVEEGNSKYTLTNPWS